MAISNYIPQKFPHEWLPEKVELKTWAQIEPWYRYNILIFANATGAQRLSAGALETRINPLEPTPDVSPLPWRLRRAVLSRLPRPVVEGLESAVHRLAIARR